MPVVDVPAVPDGFDNQAVGLAIPGDDRTVVAGMEFVVGIAGQFLQSVGGPVFRLAEFLHQSLLRFGVEALQ